MPATPQGASRGKKSKKSNTSPTRAKYWNSGRLAAKKIRNLMKHNGLTRAQALQYWAEVRGGRRMNGGMPKTVLTPKEQSELYKKIA